MGQPVPLSLPHAVPLEALGTRRQSPLSHVPREGGDPEASRTDRWLALIWIPAFAGNVVEREGMKPPTPASPVLPPLGEDLLFLDLPPLGEVARRAVGGLVYNRVIASEAKQPRGLKRSYADVPLGGFGVSRLAMTRLCSC